VNGGGRGQPVGVLAGDVPNPQILRGQIDLDTRPVLTPEYSTRWADWQMGNGWQNTNMGLRLDVNGAGYLAVSQPRTPGLDRLSGQRFSDFVPRGPAPSQWTQMYAYGPGSQPQTPGGPGQAIGNIVPMAGNAGA
jgi:hypothetical protein